MTVVQIAIAVTVLWGVCVGCPEHLEPPCTCRFVGYHSSVITCANVTNEIELEKSVQSMRTSTVPIKSVEIFDTNINFLPSGLFRGLEVPRLFIAGSSMVSLSDTETAFEGLEGSLETLVINECTLFGGWKWTQLRNLRALTELSTVKAGLLAIDEDVKAIAHLNITRLYFTQDSISYIHDTAFSTFQNLVTLSLKRNAIRTMKRSMLPNPALQLQQILLSYNAMEFVPPDLFSNMPNLMSIILSGNKILTVDETAFGPVWGHLKKIDLVDNPLRCDCRMSWLLKIPFPLNTWAECQEPQVLKGVSLKKLEKNDLWC